MVKGIIQFIGYGLSGLALVLFVAWLVLDEPEPQGASGKEADLLAQAMMQSVNKHAWDSIKLISWNYKGLRKFSWDKENHRCMVRWDDNLVKIDLNKISGRVYSEGQPLEGPKADKTIKLAWDYFNNDSFWLNPVVKAFDPGTSRSLVTLSDGRKGLKIHYASGGTTPGDSYVWILDQNNRPVAWKMWVKILPFDGLEATWEDWVT